MIILASISCDAALSVVFWSILAGALATVLLFLFDLVTPGKLCHQVFKEGNRAAATVYGAVFIGLCIVIASAMH